MGNKKEDKASEDINPATESNEVVLEGVSSEAQASKPGIKAKLHNFKNWYLTHKKIAIPLTVVALLLLLMLVPYTRYKILGLFIQKDVTVFVTDSKSDSVVSDADVSIGSVSSKTNGKGLAELKNVPVGQYTLKVTKKYYNDSQQNITVTTAENQAFKVKLEATGRQVSVKVSNSISQKSVEGISIKAGEAEAKTDDKGEAVLVLPVGTTKVNAELSGEGYVAKKIEIEASDTEIKQNDETVTPAGKIYFLSKASGKIDVVKTNLDGTDRKVVLAGTGKEEEYGTVLLASRDWKYLALHSKRDDKPAKLYLIETNGDKLTTMDEGDASFDLVGWSNDKFVYKVTRNAPKQWESKKYALKSYDAPAKKINLIDESQAIKKDYTYTDPETNTTFVSGSSYAWQIFGSVYIIDSKLIYEKDWSPDSFYSDVINDKKDEVLQVSDTGGGKKLLKDFQNISGQVSYLQSFLYEPREIYYKASYSGAEKYYEYTSDGQFKEDSGIKNDFEKYYGPTGYYKTYLLSPSAKQTFWSEDRDGKRVLFTGNQDAEGEKQVAVVSDGQTYGWFTDDYLLVSKKSSELYIMPQTGISNESQLVKISDYHRPAYQYYGYGGGYGGL